MSKRNSLFRETDLKRAIRGARAGGLEIQRIEVAKKTGDIIIFPKVNEDAHVGVNEWDAAAE